MPVVDGRFQIPFRPSGVNEGRVSSLVALEPEIGLVAWEIEMPFSGWAYLFPVPDGVVFACACGRGSVVAGVGLDGEAQWMQRIVGWYAREAVVGGDTLVVILASGDGRQALAAVDVIDGSVRWTTATEVWTTGVTPRLAAIDETILVVEGESEIRSLSSRDGTEVWKVSARGPVGSPFLDGERVLLPIAGGLSAVDVETGNTSEVIAPPATNTDPGIDAVMIRSGNLLGVLATTARNPGRDLVGAFDLETGTAIWTQRINHSQRHQVWGSEILVLGSAFGGAGNAIEAWDLTTGEQLWIIEAKRKRIPPQTATATGTTTFAVIDRHLQAIDAAGTASWSLEAPADPVTPTIIESLLIVPTSSGDCVPGDTGEIAARNPTTGAAVWQTPIALPPRYTIPSGYAPINHSGLLIFFTGHCETGTI